METWLIYFKIDGGTHTQASGMVEMALVVLTKKCTQLLKRYYLVSILYNKCTKSFQHTTDVGLKEDPHEFSERMDSWNIIK